jgi:hypothetical protein
VIVLSGIAEKYSGDTVSDSEAFNYKSVTLKRFIEGIEKNPDGRLLDLGPVFNDNINFFSHRVKRLYICDLYRRLDEDIRDKRPPSQFSRHLDYPSETFDRILFWDLADRLDNSHVSHIVDRCFEMITPGGIIMVLTMGDQVSPIGRDAFIVREDFQLYLKPQAYPHLAAHYRQNRDIMHLLLPFTPLKSLIYRNGIREFLFQRD